MRFVAVGDPQADFDTLLSILERHDLLSRSSQLKPDVHLISMGDHFDYGPVTIRERAAHNGLATLTWLASHPPEQVTLLLGNHDLARVCELEPFSDDTFAQAHAHAIEVRTSGVGEQALLERYPSVPDAECLARDYACFTEAQRELVTTLLRSRRFRLAAHHRDLLLVHAGVTIEDFASIGHLSTTAQAAADALNAALDRAVEHWSRGSFNLTPLHLAGSAATGEGRGILYHRPCDPRWQPPERLSGPPRRRFDPRRLPSQFPQAVGHIRDGKCFELMPEWSELPAAADGPIRSLRIDGERVRYLNHAHHDARLFFVDGGMFHTAPERYELFDLDTRKPVTSRRP